MKLRLKFLTSKLFPYIFLTEVITKLVKYKWISLFKSLKFYVEILNRLETNFL